MVTIVIWTAVNYHEDNLIGVVKFRKDFIINPFCQKVKHQMSVVKAMVSAFICNSINTFCTSLSQSSLPPLSPTLSSRYQHHHHDHNHHHHHQHHYQDHHHDQRHRQARPVLTSVGRGKPVLKVTVGGELSMICL